MGISAEKSIPNKVENLGELTGWLGEWIEAKGIDPSAAYKLRLAMEEIASNALFYGFPTGDAGTVTVRATADVEARAHTLEILDNGRAFDPLNDTPEADTEHELDDREIGGLGVFLVQNLADECSYARVNGWNHLTILIKE